MDKSRALCHGVKAARVPALRSPGAQAVLAGSPASRIGYLVVFAPPMFTFDVGQHHI